MPSILRSQEIHVEGEIVDALVTAKGFLVAESIDHEGNTDTRIESINWSGTRAWSWTSSLPGDEFYQTLDADFGKVLVVIQSPDNSAVARLDENGNQSWVRTFGDSEGITCAEAIPDGLIVGGGRAYGVNAIIYRYLDNGTRLWRTEFPNDYWWDVTYCIAAGDTGLVAGCDVQDYTDPVPSQLRFCTPEGKDLYDIPVQAAEQTWFYDVIFKDSYIIACGYGNNGGLHAAGPINRAGPDQGTRERGGRFNY
nr:hypothetical protein [Candidatus Sigynarchaeota archaeon]